MSKRSFVLILLSFSFAFAAKSQEEQKFSGAWEGILNAGIKLRVIFHLQPSNNKSLKAILDIPDQSAFGIIGDTVTVIADNLEIKMNQIHAAFAGKLINDSTINGTFIQGIGIPLLLKKVDEPSVPKRPQTPQPPFPYKSEDVEYDNADRSLHYGATITIPEGKGPFPAAVLITGSGPQDRNETLFGHQAFAVLADALTKNGIVVLRVDDRGIGKSTGVFDQATSADFAIDVNTSLDYLLTRPEVDKKKIGLIGHSEGGMIAPIVATQRKDIDFLVLLAAPGIKIVELMAEQNEAILRSSGISQPAIEAYIPFYKSLMKQLIGAADSTAASDSAKVLFQQWVMHTDMSILKEMGLGTEEARQRVIATLIHEFSIKWFSYFFAFDPQPYLQKIRARVLALNGSKDIQVTASSNLAGIRAALKKSRSKNYTVKELPGLNHLFQTCKTCTLTEYGELEETFSPIALQEINEWLNKNVK